jgi:hypothetical protein
MASQPQSDIKEKDTYDFDKNIVIGIKFHTGPIDLGDMDDDLFKDNVGFRFKLPDEFDKEKLGDTTGVFTGDNSMTCKFFDNIEGIMYVHFDYEVNAEDLHMFDADELIYKKVVA